MAKKPYILCKVCGHTWESRDSFLADEEIHLIGYQSNFIQIDKGLFLFNHICDGTLAIPVNEFVDLYDGPIYRENKTGTQECPGYCLYESELRPCPAKCNCAFVREILTLLSAPKLCA